MRKTQTKRSRSGRPALLKMVVAMTAVVAFLALGVLSLMAQAAPMDPPVMVPGTDDSVAVSWLPVDPIGANDTTYTLSYDTEYPFTATQTVTTIGTSAIIDGVDGVTYYAIVQADDGSGDLSDPSAVSQATADGRAPVSSFVPSPASSNGANGWYTSATALISVEDTNSGLQSLTVNSVDVSADTIFGLPPDPSTYPVTLVEGVNDYSFFGTDIAGNVENPAKTASLKLDSVVPTCVLTVSSGVPTSATITATITAGDAAPGSGVDHVEYVFLPVGTTPTGGTAWTTVSGGSANPTVPAARRTLFARSVDVAGNISIVQSANTLFDATAPVTTMVTTPVSPTGPSGSWLTAPSIALNVTDADPSTTTYYSWNDAVTIATVGTHPTVPLGAGTQTLRYFTVDAAGNKETTHTIAFLVLNQQSYTITPSHGANGSISPATPQTVTGGSSQSFTMTPDPGYHIASVLVDGVSVGTPTSYDFTVVATNHTISVTFSALPTFSIVPSAGAHGAISPATAQTLSPGANATFTITPDAGYQVADVLVDSVSIGAASSYTFHSLAANHTISATFSALPKYTIVSAAGVHGMISPATTQTLDPGVDATFTVTPDFGYHVADVLVDGVSVGAVSSYTFHSLAADHTISATFSFTQRVTSVSISANHYTVTHPHTVSFSGKVVPNRLNRTRVGFYVQKPGSSTWIRLSTRYTYAGRKWTYSYRLTQRGTYHFRVKISPTPTYLGATSRTISVRAR
jgi:hypothetical protein